MKQEVRAMKKPVEQNPQNMGGPTFNAAPLKKIKADDGEFKTSSKESERPIEDGRDD
jgi:hypothetical protein